MTSLTGLQPWLRPYGEALLRAASTHPVRVTSVYRSYSDQLLLWLNRSRNPYPVAPPGRSWHQYGRAFDVAGPPAVLEQLGAIWRSWGGTWSESDNIHFQA
jgi:antirestriction protein ArdC